MCQLASEGNNVWWMSKCSGSLVSGSVMLATSPLFSVFLQNCDSLCVTVLNYTVANDQISANLIISGQ